MRKTAGVTEISGEFTYVISGRDVTKFPSLDSVERVIRDLEIALNATIERNVNQVFALLGTDIKTRLVMTVNDFDSQPAGK